MKKINTLSEQIERMKSLMGEEILYGNSINNRELITEQNPFKKLGSLFGGVPSTSISRLMRADVKELDDVFNTFIKRQDLIDIELNTNKIDVGQHKKMSDNNKKALKSEVDAVWGDGVGKGINKSNIQKQLMQSGVSQKIAERTAKNISFITDFLIKGARAGKDYSEITSILNKNLAKMGYEKIQLNPTEVQELITMVFRDSDSIKKVFDVDNVKLRDKPYYKFDPKVKSGKLTPEMERLNRIIKKLSPVDRKKFMAAFDEPARTFEGKIIKLESGKTKGVDGPTQKVDIEGEKRPLLDDDGAEIPLLQDNIWRIKAWRWAGKTLKSVFYKFDFHVKIPKKWTRSKLRTNDLEKLSKQRLRDFLNGQTYSNSSKWGVRNLVGKPLKFINNPTSAIGVKLKIIDRTISLITYSPILMELYSLYVYLNSKIKVSKEGGFEWDWDTSPTPGGVVNNDQWWDMILEVIAEVVTENPILYTVKKGFNLSADIFKTEINETKRDFTNYILWKTYCCPKDEEKGFTEDCISWTAESKSSALEKWGPSACKFPDGPPESCEDFLNAIDYDSLLKDFTTKELGINSEEYEQFKVITFGTLKNTLGISIPENEFDSYKELKKGGKFGLTSEDFCEKVPSLAEFEAEIKEGAAKNKEIIFNKFKQDALKIKIELQMETIFTTMSEACNMVFRATDGATRTSLENSSDWRNAGTFAANIAVELGGGDDEKGIELLYDTYKGDMDGYANAFCDYKNRLGKQKGLNMGLSEEEIRNQCIEGVKCGIELVDETECSECLPEEARTLSEGETKDIEVEFNSKEEK